MRTHILKRIRVIISLLFFIAVTFLFLDIKNFIVEDWSQPLLYLQFAPSLMKFLYTLSVGAAGFIVVLILTAIFGRVYCSSICPLGTFQDVVTYVSKKKKKIRYKFRIPSKILRYSLLGVTILLLLLGSTLGFILLDPFSNYGRFLTNFIKPVIMLGNNILVATLELFDNYSVYPAEIKSFNVLSAIFPFVVLVTVVWLAIKYGRLYCNTICPVGTFLGLLSRYSIFRIVINEDSCSGCGVCERVCKSECIESKNKYVDQSRCVECFNCLSVCPSSGIEFTAKRDGSEKNNESATDSNKRDFLKKTGVFLLGLTSISRAQEKIKVYVDNDVPVIRKNPISPPGSFSLEHFTDNCTACSLCVSACPTQVLQPSFLEYGFLGMLQPRLDNSKGFCNYECTACMDVCPAGAILPKPLDDKKLIQIGKAKFIKENCVVETQGTDCGACAEHCPTKAVKMVEYVHPKYPGKFLKIPEVTEEICIGCGACEYACPAKPWRSIYVESNEVHELAKKPPEEKVEQEVSDEEDFPF